MRFLYTDNNGTPKLTKELLGEDETPQYAILSHRWSEKEVTFTDLTAIGQGTDEEMTFQHLETTLEDLTTTTGRDNDNIGWNKIRFCMQQAAKDGLRFSWVDTCCIKKDDATELQYSINSMFRWYKGAAKCYVYMADVPSKRTRTTYWQSYFKRSKWFTRGWTLQELLAPSQVVFFSQEGDVLGSLDELRDLVQAITKLPLSALSGADLGQFQIEQRLSWTANRYTTRPEDKAYSLLGIFNIFMPLIYGEGEENAFRRLRNEIRERKYFDMATLQFSENDFDCLRSLSFSEQTNRYHNIYTARETCKWLLKNPAFRRWMNSSCGLFWVKGNPGVGKSVLMKYVVDSLQGSDRAGVVCSYFVWAQGTELQRTPIGIFRAILSDLLRLFPDHIKGLTKKFIDRNQKHGAHVGSWTWSQSELEREFENLLKTQSSNRPITILVDALDELGAIPAQYMLRFFHTLTTAVQRENRRARFCVSSRHYPIIGHDNIRHVNVEQENLRDLEWYIRERVQEIDATDFRRDIERQLLSKSQGAFQWAKSVIESIIAGDLIGMSHRTLLRQIASCPDNLGELYSALIQHGSEHDKRRSLTLFQWVLYAKSPLTASALRDALAVSANEYAETSTESAIDPQRWDTAAAFERYIKHLSKGLVRLQQLDADPWNSKVQLMHQSVADWLLDAGLDGIGTSDAKAAHLQLAKACLRYRTSEEILHAPDSEDFMTRFPLAKYVSDHILTHTVGAGGLALLEPDLVKIFAALPIERNKIPLQVAVERNLEEIIRHLVNLDPSAVETTPWIGTPTALLSAWEISQQTQHFGIVSFLMSFGRFSEQSLTLARFFHELCGTANLENLWAVDGSQEAARRLLNSNLVDINEVDTNGCSLLWHAAYNGHDILVEFLLHASQEVQVNARYGWGSTPLHQAALRGHVRIVELLLDTGKADVNIMDWLARTPLMRACEEGHEQIANMLLAHGAIPWMESSQKKLIKR